MTRKPGLRLGWRWTAGFTSGSATSAWGTRTRKPKPFITFGMVMLPAVFGCEIVFEKDALPWAVPLNLSEDQIMKLEVPDLSGPIP